VKSKKITILDVDRSDPKLAYSKSKPMGSEVNDKVHSLERENIQLKTKENLLELEIKK
jgi:hypothetical protein